MGIGLSSSTKKAPASAEAQNGTDVLLRTRSDASGQGGKQEGERCAVHCAPCYQRTTCWPRSRRSPGRRDRESRSASATTPVSLRAAWSRRPTCSSDGVHFDAARMSPRDIGHRAAAASLSDMAAMGAEPVCLLAAVGVPAGYRGRRRPGGGDGRARRPARRRRPVPQRGARRVGHRHRPGRATGAALRRPPRRPARRHRDAGRSGGERVYGAGDAAARRGPRAGSESQPPCSTSPTASPPTCAGWRPPRERARSSSSTGCRAPRARRVEQAAAGGEDYELLAAVPAGAAMPGARDRGGTADRHGRGRRSSAPPATSRALRGWDHFA